MFSKDTIDKDCEREAMAISRHRELNGIDVRQNGKVSYRQQRMSARHDAEKKLFGG